jgi:ABC-type branched-subunit amino acid transport system ATPase component
VTTVKVETPVIEARGVDAGYGTVPVVTDLNLQVRAGEIVCLVGSNGAGKTTSLLTLAGELSPQGGEVVWRGSSARMSLDRRARDGLRFVTEERSISLA